MAATELPPTLPLDTNFDAFSKPIHILIGIFVPVTSISLGLRFYARWKTSMKTGWDDWLAVLAYVIWIVYVALVIWVGKNGNGYNPLQLPLPQLKNYLMAVYVTPMITAALMTAAKFSILTLYLRLFRSDKSFRLRTYIVGGLCMAWFVAAVLTSALQCAPVEAAWNPLITNRKCINYGLFALGIEVPNGILDFIIALIAVQVIRGLQLNLYQKIGLIVIFVCATFVAIVGFVRIAVTYNPEQFTTNALAFWLTVQNAFAIICCNLLTYRPLIPKVLKNPITTLRGSRMPASKQSNNQNSAHSKYLHLDGSRQNSRGSDVFGGWDSQRKVNATRDSSPESGMQEFPMGKIHVKHTLETETRSML